MKTYSIQPGYSPGIVPDESGRPKTDRYARKVWRVRCAVGSRWNSYTVAEYETRELAEKALGILQSGKILKL